MAEETDERDGRTPTRSLRVSPLRSLPARISFIVFGATLITSLAVTAISVRSIDSFLRGKIEQKFPAVLESANQRLDLWYDQRLLELGVFASSGILTQNLPRIGPGTSRPEVKRARSEIEQYLAYVLDSFPQYDSLFVLAPDGDELLWVGSRLELSGDALHRLSRVSDASLSGALRSGERSVQVASARVEGGRKAIAGSLHAVMQMSAVTSVLKGQELGESGEIFLLDADNRYLSASEPRLAMGSFQLPTRDPASDSPVVDYYDHSGERVVGCSRPFPRFGWVLAVEEPYSAAFAPVVSGIRRVLGINLAIVLVFCLAAFRVAASIARPIEALSDAARRISGGEKNVQIPASHTRDEVGVLTRSFDEMTNRLASNARELQVSQSEIEGAFQRVREQNEELQRMNEILEQLSITDGLTKLHNHRYFQEHLVREVKRADRTAEPLSLILIDIDHFKRWNDRLGHSGGDDILRRIADIMQQLTRETDLLARYGGEEFVLLLPNTELDGALRLAEKIRCTVAETAFFLEQPAATGPLTVSVGVSVYQGDGRTFFDEADRALYRAKAAGRDCVMVGEPGEGEGDEKPDEPSK